MLREWKLAFALAALGGLRLFAQTTPENLAVPLRDDVEYVGAEAESADAPKAAAPETTADTPCCDCDCCFDWEKIPRQLRAFPRPGFFPIPPSGPGYYTALEHLHGYYREKPRPSGYPPFALMAPSNFDADWRYVEKLKEAPTCVESLKRMHLNDCLMVNTGGSYWTRFMDEHNSRLTAADNDYALGRLRLYGDVHYGDLVRFYAEYLWADSWEEDLAPLAIDVNRGDILNMFVDVQLFDCDCHPVYARIGRQELLLGSQRLVSPLDWANTRRTFEGVRVMRTGEEWDFDAFWTEFVPVKPSDFDTADHNQDFAGLWLTQRPEKGHFRDFYYLYLNNQNLVNNLPAPNTVTRFPAEIHTLGTRNVGDRDGWLWDFEGMLQFGDQNGQDLFAGAATAGVGRNWKEHCWNPTAWLYYDYASGDSDPTDGNSSTFNQLYPFGHYYMGWADQVARQNIHDINAHLYFYPENWITVWCQYHKFYLAERRDALYNPAGAATRRDVTGAAGRDVGSEFDIVANFHVATYTDLMFGYCHLFGGDFLANTGTGINRGVKDNELLFFMFNQRW